MSHQAVTAISAAAMARETTLVRVSHSSRPVMAMTAAIAGASAIE